MATWDFLAPSDRFYATGAPANVLLGSGVLLPEVLGTLFLSATTGDAGGCEIDVTLTFAQSVGLDGARTAIDGLGNVNASALCTAIGIDVHACADAVASPFVFLQLQSHQPWQPLHEDPWVEGVAIPAELELAIKFRVAGKV